MAALTVGIVGMVVVLIAYTLNQLGRLHEDHPVYDGLNFIGALLLIVYALVEQVWPFLFLNAVWGTVAGWDLYVRFKPKAKPAAAGEPSKEKKPEPAKEEKPAEPKP